MLLGKKDIKQTELTSQGQIVLYEPDESTRLEVKLDESNNTVWLSIDQMSTLFGRDKSVIGKHVRTIFKEEELQKDSVWAKFAYTATDGKTSLEAIATPCHSNRRSRQSCFSLKNK